MVPAQARDGDGSGPHGGDEDLGGSERGGQGGSLKRQVECSEMTLSQMGSSTAHPAQELPRLEGPGTFQWAKDCFGWYELLSKKLITRFIRLTVAYFAADKSVFFFFFFWSYTVMEEEK